MSCATASGVFAVVLITQLGSPHYHRRATANRALQRMAPLILPHLEAARDHRDTEISQRSTRVLAAYYEKMADILADRVRPTKWPRLPWLDMLPQDHPRRRVVIDQFLHQAQQRIGRKGPPEWEDYRLATQLYMRDMFLNQRRPRQVRGLLNRMADAERTWISSNGKKYSPPLKLPK